MQLQFKNKWCVLTLLWQSLYHIENGLLIFSANQWAGFYMIETSFMKELMCFPHGEIHSCQHNDLILIHLTEKSQKQPSRGVLRKMCSENIQQVYRRTPMPKCDFNKVSLQLIEITHGYSPVNLLRIFRTPFTKNTSGRLLLKNVTKIIAKIPSRYPKSSYKSSPIETLHKSNFT